MRIVMIASEVTPFAKTGGLADVLGALPSALARLGHRVDVVLPRYRGIAAGQPAGSVSVRLGGAVIEAPTWIAGEGDVRTIFIEHAPYFDREHLYGPPEGDYADNPERFAFLAKAALEWADTSPGRVDVLHAHDWQAGLAPVILQQGSATQQAGRTPAVFTIHNLAYQGVFDASWLGRLGLDASLMGPGVLEYWGRISFLKGGLMCSRCITTVSARYAEEIQTPEFGFGFDGIVRHRSADLVGVLNGIDYDQWDPSRDPYLPKPFDADRLEGKRAAKRLVLELFGLRVNTEILDRPLIGMVSRLVDQKGFDLIADVADELGRLDASVVLLGTGDRRYEELWRSLAARYPDRIGVHIGFNEALAHQVEGGADLFLMPSRFEPCGLNQMYSLRYGTVPVVRAVGGLFDTVHDFNPRTGEGNGFSFEPYSGKALLEALRRALEAFRQPEVWRTIQRRGMLQDFSWDASAREYVKVYERAKRTETTHARGGDSQHGI